MDIILGQIVVLVAILNKYFLFLLHPLRDSSYKVVFLMVVGSFPLIGMKEITYCQNMYYQNNKGT